MKHLSILAAIVACLVALDDSMCSGAGVQGREDAIAKVEALAASARATPCEATVVEDTEDDDRAHAWDAVATPTSTTTTLAQHVSRDHAKARAPLARRTHIPSRVVAAYPVRGPPLRS